MSRTPDRRASSDDACRWVAQYAPGRTSIRAIPELGRGCRRKVAMSMLAAWRPSRATVFVATRHLPRRRSTEIGPAGDPREIARIDISIPPTARACPRVQVRFRKGAASSAQKCAVCPWRQCGRHPSGDRFGPAGSVRLARPMPLKKRGVLLALCDDGVRYIRRAMPISNPAKSLQNDEGVCCHRLHPFVRQHRSKDAVLDAGSCPKCRCPTAPGFVNWEPRC